MPYRLSLSFFTYRCVSVFYLVSSRLAVLPFMEPSPAVWDIPGVWLLVRRVRVSALVGNARVPEQLRAAMHMRSCTPTLFLALSTQDFPFVLAVLVGIPAPSFHPCLPSPPQPGLASLHLSATSLRMPRQVKEEAEWWSRSQARL